MPSVESFCSIKLISSTPPSKGTEDNCVTSVLHPNSNDFRLGEGELEIAGLRSDDGGGAGGWT